MEIHFITQRIPDQISKGDQIVLSDTDQEGITSGKYTVVMLTESEDEPNSVDVTLVGADGTRTAGTITVITLGGRPA